MHAAAVPITPLRNLLAGRRRFTAAVDSRRRCRGGRTGRTRRTRRGRAEAEQNGGRADIVARGEGVTGGLRRTLSGGGAGGGRGDVGLEFDTGLPGAGAVGNGRKM